MKGYWSFTTTGVTILVYIREFMQINHFAPTLTEIARDCYLSDRAVQKHVCKLTEAGYLTRNANARRFLRLTGKSFEDQITAIEHHAPIHRRYLGVGKYLGAGKFWIAEIRHDNRTVHIGCYATIEDAARAYDAYVIEHGLDRAINFPQERTA